MTAQEIKIHLDNNYAGFKSGFRTYREFAERNAQIWDVAASVGLTDAVKTLLREEERGS